MCVMTLRLFGLTASEPVPHAIGIIYERDEEDGVPFPCFDTDAVLMRLRVAFDGITIDGQDVLMEEARRVEALLTDHGMGNNPLVGSLYQKARDVGPALHFNFQTPEGDSVSGFVRRFDISFRHGAGLSEGTLGKLKHFLRSFGAGEIEDRRCGDDRGDSRTQCA